jgi:hypothetical protein
MTERNYIKKISSPRNFSSDMMARNDDPSAATDADNRLGRNIGRLAVPKPCTINCNRQSGVQPRYSSRPSNTSRKRSLIRSRRLKEPILFPDASSRPDLAAGSTLSATIGLILGTSGGAGLSTNPVGIEFYLLSFQIIARGLLTRGDQGLNPM